MGFTRRNAIIGLGALAGGAGVIGGTGAFTTVEADREVTINTVGDGSANLGLTLNDGDFNALNDNGGEGEQGSAIIGIEINNLNDNAVTTFDGAITVENNGTDDIELTVDTSDVAGLSITPDPLNVNTGETEDLDLSIDTNVPDAADGGTITFTATAQ